MKAAIYARYSSENQRPESIEDQISACRRLASNKKFTILEEHIYSDYAQSGSRKDRIGLNALLTASQQHPFDVVLVDDLSRLARDNFLMLSVLADLNFEGVRVISVADGLDSSDEEATLGIQIRGIFNELQLRDLKKKTMRGLIGQKKRGFSVGERTMGYKSVPVGEISIDKKGKARPEGYKVEIEPRESAIVVRIFEDYKAGNSINRIVKTLNEEGVLGRNKIAGTWSPGTISRILDNEKYVGNWVWNKTESRKDPRTGRRRRFTKPKSEWITIVDESLRIIPQNLWEAVRQRRTEVSKSWPGGKGKHGFSSKQKSCESRFPSHLFSGMMTCGSCGSAITQLSGNNGGYLGCLASRKGTCTNNIKVRRNLAEKLILDEVNKQIANPDNFSRVLRKVEDEVAKSYADVPEIIRQKERELTAENRRLANFVEFIAEGRGNQTIAKALEETEKKVQTLETEINGLRRTHDKVFQTPPKEWIEEKLSKLEELLKQNTGQSAMALRKLLGPITFEPTYPDIGKPYYVVKSGINALKITTPLSNLISADKGADSYLWWRWRELNPRPRALCAPATTCLVYPLRSIILCPDRQS